MKISRIDIYTFDIKHEAYRHFTALVDTLKEVFIKITTDNGFTGFGEARGNFQYVLGQNQEGMVGTENLVTVNVEGKDANYLRTQLNKRIDARRMRGVKVLVVNNVCYLEKT